jgi:hypothetical protein
MLQCCTMQSGTSLSTVQRCLLSFPPALLRPNRKQNRQLKVSQKCKNLDVLERSYTYRARISKRILNGQHTVFCNVLFDAVIDNDIHTPIRRNVGTTDYAYTDNPCNSLMQLDHPPAFTQHGTIGRTQTAQGYSRAVDWKLYELSALWVW